jgi:hypothetical protein
MTPIRIDTQDHAIEMRAGGAVERGKCRAITERDASEHSSKRFAAVRPVILW